ncbi:MAG: phosphatase PAP2 family protein [Stigonema ocellatum SAG 48.90 = DSM 106950]|nr:phosphatase PAP2 family protein [Stigonema ocellatum SAG 48.90 = DSM 106950]
MFQTDVGKLFQSFINFFRQLLVANGRSLLLLLIGVYLPLQIFGLLALQLRQNEGGFPWDLPILLAIHKTSQANLDVFAGTLTKFGSSRVVLPIVGVIGLVFLSTRRWRSLTYLLTTVLGSNIINRTVKELMHRIRPHLWDSPFPELDYAFPSGHAMTSMALVAAVIILTWGSAWRWLILMLGSLFVLAIAWTRLYLGVHFPSDILAGWMVSIAWAIGVSLILKPQLTQASVENVAQPVNETTLRPEETQHNS